MRAALLVAALALCACTASTNLLTGKPVTGVGGAEKLADGVSASEGDGWDSPSALIIPPGAALIWDFGTPTELDSLSIQADNNDDYVFSISDDGVTFHELWVAGPVLTMGLSTRARSGLHATARFLRLDARGGDTRYSVTEVEALPKGAIRIPNIPRLNLLWGALVLLTAFALFGVALRPQWSTLLMGANTVFGLYVLQQTWSVPQLEGAPINFIRAAVAALAFVGVLRELWRPAQEKLQELHVLGVMGSAAVLALLCFLNMGRPQFFDAGRAQPTFLHHYDMRTYYLIAKYMPELRFDGVYVASAQAVADDRGRESMLGQPLRDLRNHQMTRFGEVLPHVDEVRARFSPERWDLFKTDALYFRRAMTDAGFLDSMHDHGGNATPVWFLLAWVLFQGSPASDGALWSGVVLDLALLALAFWALWKAFGIRTALVAATVFGAMDFYQFGTNWFGAALRHDWLALWALSLWALKRERFALAGALLAWSTLIRAFPALAFITLAVPHVWIAVRAKSLSLSLHKNLLRVAFAAIGAAVVLTALSSLVFGGHIWVEWLDKVSRLNSEDHMNNLALHTWVTGDHILYPLLVLACLTTVAYALRQKPPAQAAAYGVVLLPIVLNPANYYLHAVFLLAVVGTEAPIVWLALLAMCSASYWTSFTADMGLHFRYDTYVLLITLGFIVLRDAITRRVEPAAAAPLAPAPQTP